MSAPAQSSALPPLIIAVACEKGGTGKTTTACNLAAALASAGSEVCVVDLDPQANATRYLGGNVKPAADAAGTWTLLSNQADLADVRRATPVPGCTLVASTGRMAFIELDDALRTLPHLPFRARLQAAGSGVRAVILDCPPTHGVLTTTALAAADFLVVSAMATPFAHDGLIKTLRLFSQLHPDFTRRIGILFTLLDEGDPTMMALVERFGREFAALSLGPGVPRDSGAEAAVRAGQPLVLANPDSPAAEAYRTAAAALAARMEALDGQPTAAPVVPVAPPAPESVPEPAPEPAPEPDPEPAPFAATDVPSISDEEAAALEEDLLSPPSAEPPPEPMPDDPSTPTPPERIEAAPPPFTPPPLEQPGPMPSPPAAIAALAVVPEPEAVLYHAPAEAPSTPTRPAAMASPPETPETATVRPPLDDDAASAASMVSAPTRPSPPQPAAALSPAWAASRREASADARLEQAALAALDTRDPDDTQDIAISTLRAARAVAAVDTRPPSSLIHQPWAPGSPRRAVLRAVLVVAAFCAAVALVLWGLGLAGLHGLRFQV